MATLITGGAGFVGSRLAERLHKNKEEFVLIDNFSYGREDNLIYDDFDLIDKCLKIDIRDKEKVHELFLKNNFEYIYNFAAVAPLPDCQNNPMEANDTNVTGFINILEEARRAGVKRVFLSSTSAVYENTKELPSREDMEIVPPSLMYPSTKYYAELVAKTYFDLYKVPITIFRFANVYGPAMDFIRKFPPACAAFIKNLYFDSPPVIYDSGEQARDFVYSEDLLDLITVAKNCEGFDILNVGTGEQHSINEMARVITKFSNKDIKPTYKDALVFWDDYPELKQGALPLDLSYLQRETVKPTLLSTKHANEKYGYTPKYSFEEGIKKTVELVVPQIERMNKKGMIKF